MTDPAPRQVIEAVASGRRYRTVDPALVERLVAEELPRSATPDEAVKRVKRRLHQAVGAYRQPSQRTLQPIRDAWHGDLGDPAVRAACRALLTTHASTRERLAELDGFYPRTWEAAGGVPTSLLDLGCGLGPLALPWMALAAEARITAVDTDASLLAVVDGFLALVGQPHATLLADLAAAELPPLPAADVALLLKLVPILDRQDRGAAARLLRRLDVHAAVVSFPVRSLGGRQKGMHRSYRTRLLALAVELEDRGVRVAEASVAGELVFVLHFAAGPAPDA